MEGTTGPQLTCAKDTRPNSKRNSRRLRKEEGAKAKEVEVVEAAAEDKEKKDQARGQSLPITYNNNTNTNSNNINSNAICRQVSTLTSNLLLTLAALF